MRERENPRSRLSLTNKVSFNIERSEYRTRDSYRG